MYKENGKGEVLPEPQPNVIVPFITWWKIICLFSYQIHSLIFKNLDRPCHTIITHLVTES